MSSLAINSLMQNFAKSGFSAAITKAPVIERTHYSGPSSGGSYHHHHQQSSHSHSGGKQSVALTALTLLSFLFFLNILQNCIQDNMDTQTTQVIVMQAREAEAQKRKGEVQLLNITSLDDQKESRINSDVREKPTKSEYNKVAQIPIKLKTVDKFKKQL